MKLHQQLSIFIALMLPAMIYGQFSDKQAIGLSYLSENAAELGLTQDDIDKVKITDIYQTKDNGVTHVYFAQTYEGIQVNQALFNLNIRPDNTIQHYGNRFVSDIKSKITKSGTVNITAAQAIVALGTKLGYPSIEAPISLKTDSKDRMHFTADDYSANKILVQPKYYKVSNGEYKLTYEVFLMEKDNSDSWFAYVDVTTGEVIGQHQNTLECQVKAGMFHNHNHECNHSHATAKRHTSAAAMGDGAKYNVVALPAESPLHGPFQIVDDPSHPVASPFGWHDEDGMEGPEHTITRGNNVWAYEDQDADDISSGNEPEGGLELEFLTEFDPEASPFENMEADVTNLFYMCNMVHDISYLVGFDESAGAFQNNNYGNGGFGNDQVLAETLDGSGTNNANFGPAPDGISGVMQMFRWEFNAGLFRITDPSAIASDYTSTYAGWGGMPLNNEVDVKGEIALGFDNNPDPANARQGCGELESDVNGKVALIFRGTCQFGLKALNAENAGAIAAIICNVPGADGPGTDGENAMGMAAGEVGEQVTIPLISLGISDCNRIIAEMANGPVTAEMKILEQTGPSELSAGFDNGVIAHEYGHGISHRLIGGPTNINCLTQPGLTTEQQGEGISDFIALVLTVEEGDAGTDPRGIGNYVDGLAIDGRGIRRFPYSTDFDICPLTYDDIKGQTAPHPVGEVWAAILWDIHWAWVDLYGWDADWNNTESGNFKAVKLAYDGMKAAPCLPGFLDMRDAIFAVDDGEHECLLWEIFARRGLGFFADQADPLSTTDGTEDFEPLPTCIKTLKIDKDITRLIDPGAEFEVTMTISNHTGETATNVTVTDILDEGLSIVPGSTSVPYTESGNDVIFEIGDMAATTDPREPGMVFSYTVISDPSISSISMMLNTFETSDERNRWLPDLGSSDFLFWDYSTLDSRSGQFSMFIKEDDAERDQRIIRSDLPITGENPTLRAWHRINCTPVDNGGWVEYSTEENIWLRFNANDFITGEYDGVLSYSDRAIPDLGGFSGFNDRGEFVPFYIDLRDFIGQEIDIRFRFYMLDFDPEVEVTFDNDNGWFVDDVELMDIKKYQTEAIIDADNTDEVRTEIFETIINSVGGDNVADLALDGVEMTLFPNPAQDRVVIKITSDRQLDSKVTLYSVDGRPISEMNMDLIGSENVFSMDISSHASGFYFIQVASEGKILTKKLIIE